MIFSAVVLVGCILFFLPGGSVDPQYGAIIREAPQIATPAPEYGCNVVPLTQDQVLAMVVDVDARGFANTRDLFSTPPPKFGEYPHTKTWLPEAGMVDMAGGLRPVRIPTAKEFQRAKNALDRYLRCQYEGTNYQLWALESPVEVQRQILTQIAQDNNWTASDPWSNEEFTETMILDMIDRLGPEQRSGPSYMYVVGPVNERVQANPVVSDAFVADDPETGEVQYAWIATEWVDSETGEIESSRGAALESTPKPQDGATSNLVVIILRYDAETDAWLVEWLVPTI